MIPTIPSFQRHNISPTMARQLLDKTRKSIQDKYLHAFLNTSSDVIKRTATNIHDLPENLIKEIIQEKCIIEWLRLFSSQISWEKITSTLRFLDSKTYENSRSLYNFIITDDDSNTSIDIENDFKIIDQLGSSLYTFIIVNNKFNLVGISGTTHSSKTQKINSLSPLFISNLNGYSDFSITRTPNSEIIISYKSAIIAMKRRGLWKVYTPSTIEKSIKSILKEKNNKRFFSQNDCGILPGVLSDISFKRHGALLLYDPHDMIIKNNDIIINKDSIILNNEKNSVRRKIADSIENISILDKNTEESKRRLVCELSSIDGALVFNNNGITAFGAYLRPHIDVPIELGTRSTAACSACKYGMTAFKASTDGDVVIYYSKSKGITEQIKKLNIL